MSNGDDIRIDLNYIRENLKRQALNMGDVADLIAEVERLNEVNKRWASGWKKILNAHAEAWEEKVQFLTNRVKELEKLL